MVLTDPENLLETGIEIYAQPPGKIRPFSRMNSLMIMEVRFSDKRFPTFIAPIGPLATVNSLMILEATQSNKRLSTFTALIRPFASVNSLMVN